MSEYHIRYGGYGGIGYYHISDIYIALFSHFIPCGVWEAVYILDGLLKNQSDIQPDTLHADTQGQSAPVFGLFFLLGINLMPRIRNWKDLKFYRPHKDSQYQNIDELFTDTIDWNRNKVTEQQILDAVLTDGARNMKDIIRLTGAMKNGQCEIKNPSGKCCHAFVQNAINKWISIISK